MDELIFIARAFLGTIFLSSSIPKFRKIEEHILVVKEYRIVPDSLIHAFVRAEMVTEFLTGLLLFFGLFQQVGVVLAILLLITYATAISINLIRGRKDISCGCGGATGNHPISWILIPRNFCLVAVAGWLYWQGEPASLEYLIVLQGILIAWLALMFFVMTSGLWDIYKRLKKFFT